MKKMTEHQILAILKEAEVAMLNKNLRYIGYGECNFLSMA